MIASLRTVPALIAGLLFLLVAATGARAAEDTFVDVVNTTADAVSIIGIGAGGEQQLLHDVPAGETYRLPTTVGAQLGFAQGNSWLGDAYVVSGAAGESVTVPYAAQAAAMPAPVATTDANAPPVQITNSTDKPVTVIAIGADKTQQVLVEVPAGQSVSQPVAAGTTLGFAQDTGWLGDAYIVTGTGGEAVTVPYAAQAAAAPTTTVDPNAPAVQITNSTDKPVTVIAIGADKTQQPLADVPAGQTVSQPVPPGTTLGFAQADGWLGDAYVTTGSGSETVTVPYQAQAATKGPAIEEFVDTSLPPVQITNSSDQPVTIVSIQPDNTQHALKEIAAGETYSQPATPGTTLGFAQGDAWLGDFYVTTGDAGEKVTVPFTQLSAEQLRQKGPDSVRVEFNNTADTPLSVAVTDDQNNATLLYDLPPGPTTQHAVPNSKLWFYKAGETQPTGDAYIVTDADGQQVTLPYSAAAAVLAAQEGPGSVSLEFTNTNTVPIIVSVVDAQNQATVIYEIPIGQIVTRRALPKSHLWFFRKGEDAPVGEPFVVPDTDATLSLPYDRVADLKEKQSGPGSVALEMRNETYGDIYVAITDRDGARADLYTIPYRNSAASGQGTEVKVMPGTQLYFFSQITEMVDNEAKQKLAGTYLVPPDGPRIIYLPYEPDMAAQKQPEPPGGISVMFKNAAIGATPDLVFVDQQSQNVFRLLKGLESWRNLAPNTTLFAFGLKNRGDTEYSQIGDAIQVGAQPGQTISVPQYNSATDLIASGKIDLKAIASQIAVSLAQQNLEADKAKVCWRNTYGRGVGQVPRNCPPGQSEDTAGLCYDNCRPGYHQFVTMCVPDCPAGFRDDGLFCFKPAPIARDEYPWKLGDSLSMDDAIARCQAEHGSNCVTANANTMVYSTCPSGYEQAPIITNLCSPVCPSNTIDIGISCQKNTYDRGVGKLMTCNSNQEYDAGLCYNGCKSGFSGVGPVCWAECPKALPVNCGASCAKSIDECVTSVSDQITTPLMTAANVALMVVTAGAGAAATEGANAARAGAEVGARAAGEVAAKVAAKEAAREGLKASVKALLRTGVSAAVKGGAVALAKDTAISIAVSGVISTAFAVGFSEKAKADLREALTAEVNQQLSSQISDAEIETVVNMAIEGSDSGGIDFPWTSLDPTGVADIVRSFNLPLCSDVH